jgi:hypothetical protein
VFLPVPESLRDVRRFVRECLAHHRHPDRVDDAVLMVGKLATRWGLKAEATGKTVWAELDDRDTA